MGNTRLAWVYMYMHIIRFCFDIYLCNVYLGHRKERKSHDSRTKKHGPAADGVSLAKSIDSTDSSAKSTVSGSEKPETHAETEEAEVEVVDEEQRKKLRMQLEEELASLDLKPKPKAKPVENSTNIAKRTYRGITQRYM